MRYSNRQDAIEQGILPSLDGDNYDVTAIFDAVYEYRVDTDKHGNELLNTAGFEQVVTEDQFWEIVRRCSL